MNYEQKYKEALERAKTKLTNEVAADIFPELKESEDERIRAKLIEFFAGYTTDEEWWGSVTEKDILAWLEKQGEQKATVPKFKIGQTIKKEGFNIGFTIAKIENGFYYDTTGSNFPINDEKNWKLVYQKPAEWSEEDEKKRKCLIKGLEDRMGFGWASDPFSREELINWLKSLKDRYTWRPSEEQMRVLGLAIRFGIETTTLVSLLNNLKKLREE